MAREITHEETRPQPVDESDGPHKMTADKDEGTVNRYEDDSPDGERREIAETNYAEE